jgi:hypothetical protein
MATVSSIPPAGSIYPDQIDTANFNYIGKHIAKLEQTNHYTVQERIRKGYLKKLFVDNLYTEGVPNTHFNVIREAIEELLYDDNKLNCMLWINQTSHNCRVYIQPRNYISSGEKHIGDIWIFYANNTVDLYMVKTK